MEEIILKARNLKFSYEGSGHMALNDFSLDIPRGAKVAFLGSNGSGKSTFFLCCNGIYRPESGTLYYNGKPMDYSRKGASLFRRIETMKKPTIAAVNGYAFGGGFEFVLCTDIRIAHEKASFRLPEVTLGIVPGFNGTQRLPRCIGMPRAKELIFTGRRIFAQEAYDMGILNKVTPLESFWEEVMAEASLIADNSASAISLVKAAMTAGEDVGIDVGKDIELGYMTACFGTPDQIEGFNSFKEKRKAVFRNRSEGI